MAKSLTSEKITLGTGSDPIRFSFLSIDKKKKFAGNQGDGKYEATALLDPSNKAHAAMIATIKSEAKKLLAAAGLDNSDLLSTCFGSGDKKKYDGYKGMVYLKAGNEIRPEVRSRANTPVVIGDKQFPYSGSYGIMTCTLWLQNNSFGKRMNANLRALQFVKPGEAFGGQRVDGDEEFEALGDEPGGSSSSGSDDDFMN